MPYRLILSPRARKELQKLAKDVQGRIAARIEALAEDPRPHGVEKLAALEQCYRVRVGDYRIIYHIRDRVLLVLVLSVGDRKQIYRDITALSRMLSE